MEQFYEQSQYQSLQDRKIEHTQPGNAVQFSERHPAARDALFAYFSEVAVHHVGVLHGEYLLMNDGLLLVDRDGKLISASVPSVPQNFYPETWLSETLGGAVRNWDTLPLLPCLPVLTSPYLANYYHFSLEVVPRLRHLAPIRGSPLLAPLRATEKAFQRDLLTRTLDGMEVVTMDFVARIRDPLLIQDTVNEEGVRWLRHHAGLAARTGNRRLYIRRGAKGTRSRHGGGISESDEFLTLLRDFAFEVVEFGAGERDVAGQVAQLDGAGIILASHGAALTNLVYQEQGTTLLEVLGPTAPRACFMQLATTVGLRYFGTYTDMFDGNGDLVVDTDELRDVLQTMV